MTIEEVSTLANTSSSYTQKIEVINLICFMEQKMKERDPNKYPNCIKLLETIFNIDLINIQPIDSSTIHPRLIRSFGILCDDLLWGVDEKIPKPQNISNMSEVKNKIINYFTEEWLPF